MSLLRKSTNKLKIGLLGVDDPADVRTYSGTPFHLCHFLRSAGHEVRILGPYPLRYRYLVKAQNRFLLAFAKRQLVWERHKLISRQYPGIIKSYAEKNPDLDVLLATSAFYIANARAPMPVVFWGDSTVAGVIDRYLRYKNLSKHTIAQSHAVEQAAITSCDLAIFSNQWAADVATSFYELNPEKVRVITYGANLLDTPDHFQIEQFIAERKREQISCILIGWDWYRKGADKAIATVGALRERGLNADLRILGCYPPSGTSLPEWVSLLGTVPKFTVEGRRRFAQLLSESHLMILPTIAECAAVVLTESSAFGVPVLSSDVGGNSSLVRQNVNGILLPPEAPVTSWADAAMRIVGDRNVYEQFARQSQRMFEEELSWACSVSRFEEVIAPLVRSRQKDESQTESCLRIGG